MAAGGEGAARASCSSAGCRCSASASAPQLLAEAAGAPPRRASEPEIGWHEVELTAEGDGDPLLGPLAPRFEAFQWHSYEFPLPAGRDAAGPQRRLPSGLPPRRRGVGRSSSTPR